MLIDLTKRELNLINISLTEYQFNHWDDKANHPIDECSSLASKIEGIKNACTCKED